MNHWFGQSIIAMLLLTPIWIAIGFYDRNFHVRPDVFVVWYFLGTALAIALFGVRPFNALVPSWQLAGSIFLIGLALGGIANLLLFRAVAFAPNPGLPVAVANVASVVIFVASIALARLLPRYFNAAAFDVRTFVGVLLTIAGVAMIAVRR